MLHLDDDDRAAIHALLSEPLPAKERPIDILIHACAEDIRAALTRGWSASRIAKKLRDHLDKKGEPAPSIETIRDRIRKKFPVRSTKQKGAAARKNSAAAAAAASPKKDKTPTLHSKPPNVFAPENDPMNRDAMRAL